jgi:hypothetical protein
MAKTKSVKSAEVELEPDAWPRFERFVRDIAKAGPQHRTAIVKKVKRRTKSAKG